MVVDKSNVESLVFKEEEGSFLVGVLAAIKSQSNKFGFVGGMDIPLIHKFAYGYAQGIHYIKPSAIVFQEMTGDNLTAWNDPTKAAELAKQMYDNGAEIVFAAAGASGLGVLQQASDSNKLAIGVDSNPNSIQPGFVLTSMVKNLDQAIYRSLDDAYNDNWTADTKALGLAENGVGWSLDEHNENLITIEMKTEVEAVKNLIISGEIQVHDYLSNNNCDDSFSRKISLFHSPFF